MENRETSKKHISFKRYFWIFLVASIFGTYFEEGMHIFWFYVKHGGFNYSRRSGLFWGPISPVYGFGAVAMLFFLGKTDDKKWKVFLKSFLLGGIIEYVLSYVQELCTGTKSWDYSDKFLNIGGRTTIPYMFFWGIAGLVLIKFVYPLMCRILGKIPRNIYMVVTYVIVALVSLDILITWTALGRKELRDKGIEPYTFIGEFYDEHFDDEYIKEKYPNMKEAK